MTLDTSALEPHIESLRQITRTLVIGLVTVGVLIASAIGANAPDTAAFATLRHVADIGFAASLVLAIVLVVMLLAKAARPPRRRRQP